MFVNYDNSRSLSAAFPFKQQPLSLSACLYYVSVPLSAALAGRAASAASAGCGCEQPADAAVAGVSRRDRRVPLRHGKSGYVLLSDFLILNSVVVNI